MHSMRSTITIVNITQEPLICSQPDRPEVVIEPTLEITLSWPTSSRIKLSILNTDEKQSHKPTFYTRALSRSPIWTARKVSYDSRLRLSPVAKVSRDSRKMVVFPSQNTSSFLAEMPNAAPLSSLCLPGTHDSMARYGWPISQCQTVRLAQQLASGIRVIDIRLGVLSGQLIAYHGALPQNASFQSILKTIHSFLTRPESCNETIVMSLMQEDFPVTSRKKFSLCVHNELMNGPGGRDMWFLENRVPLLGEVRGKVVMMSRFGGDGAGWENGLEGMGIHPTAWPDSAKDGFTWWCKDTLVRTQDWYSIPSFLSIPEKVSLATELLLPPPNSPPFPTLSISYTSAASFPLAPPSTIALGIGWPGIFGFKGVNKRVTEWLVAILSQYPSSQSDNVESLLKYEDKDREVAEEKGGKDYLEPRVRGWVFVDYCDADKSLVPLLIECNYHGRTTGQEGW